MAYSSSLSAFSQPPSPSTSSSAKSLRWGVRYLVAKSLGFFVLELLGAGRERDVVVRESSASVLDAQPVGHEPQCHLAPGEPFLSVDPPMLETGVTEGVQFPGEPVREERALEVVGMVADPRHPAQRSPKDSSYHPLCLCGPSVSACCSSRASGRAPPPAPPS